jgi:nucleotide-binding universal stress UspA family protein
MPLVHTEVDTAMARPTSEPVHDGFDRATDGPGTILVGVDDSDASLNALAYAVGSARRSGSRLFVVWVQSAPVGPVAIAGVAFNAVLPVGADAQADGWLRSRLAAVHELLPVPPRVVIRVGDPAQELRRLAQELRADQVVVGASRSRWHRMVGGIGQRLCSRISAPVTVVP